jgi:TPR repeat protein
MYLNGNGVRQNYKEAYKWYELAAGQGDIAAKCAIAELYADGKGVKKDLKKAKKIAKEGYETGVNGSEYCKEVWRKYNLANY